MRSVDWDLYRTYYPILKRLVYLDNASMQPLPVPVRRSLTNFLQKWEDGRIQAEITVDYSEPLREKAARFIGAKASEIAFTQSTSEGVMRACYGIPFEAGDNIILPGNEFPSNVYPWLELRERGVEVRMVTPQKGWNVTAYDLISATDAKTRLIAASHVSFITGYRMDLKRLGEYCRKRGIFSFVDAMQSVGAVEIDLGRLPIDMLAFQGVKWIPGPAGAGILYVASDVLETLRPNHTGWLSVQRKGLDDLLDYDLPRHQTARRFDGGSPSVLCHHGISAGLDLLNEVGKDQIESRLLFLTGHLLDGLSSLGIRCETPRDPRLRAGIVSFKMPNAKAHAEWLKSKGIIVSARGPMIRVSPHFYNNEEDLDRLLEALSSRTRE